jgi:uncharacterized membrane protein
MAPSAIHTQQFKFLSCFLLTTALYWIKQTSTWKKAMGYLIAAIVLGMLVWAGIEIVQTIRNWESNPSASTRKIQTETFTEAYCGQFGGDALEGGSEAVGHAIGVSHCATEAAAVEASGAAIGSTLEGLSHFLHH